VTGAWPCSFGCFRDSEETPECANGPDSKILGVGTEQQPVFLGGLDKAGVTLRGVSGGSRPVISKRSPCGLFLDPRIDFLWTACTLGFVPTHVHVRSLALVPLVRKLLPGAAIVSSFDSGWVRELPSVVFVQGYAHAFRHLFEEVDFIFATKARKRQLGLTPPGWSVTYAAASHAGVGGVTDSKDACFCWARGSNRDPLQVSVPTALPRDVHSVIGDTVAGKPCSQPKETRLDRPAVVELSPGCYHGGGLLPLDVPSARFRVRCVYSRSRWCERRLTAHERAAA
jgi:hypothetical protein